MEENAVSCLNPKSTEFLFFVSKDHVRLGEVGASAPTDYLKANFAPTDFVEDYFLYP